VALFEAQSQSFVRYAGRVVENAKALADGLMERGWKLVSDGTDTHLLLVDLRATELSGKDAEEYLGRADITVNKNTVPGETRSPFVTSGIRIGTPALTTRGMDPSDMREIAHLIDRALRSGGDEDTLEGIRAEVEERARQFPLVADSEVRATGIA
jgi:glycine hydroxymethyltransferase